MLGVGLLLSGTPRTYLDVISKVVPKIWARTNSVIVPKIVVRASEEKQGESCAKALVFLGSGFSGREEEWGGGLYAFVKRVSLIRQVKSPNSQPLIRGTLRLLCGE